MKITKGGGLTPFASSVPSSGVTVTPVAPATSSNLADLLIEIMALIAGANVAALDEGASLTSALASVNFVGAGVTATNTGDAVTVTIPGGAGGDTSGQFIVGFDAGIFLLAAGKQQDMIVPFTGTITSWTILADVTGSAVVDIWMDTYANFAPTVADSITAAAKPTLSNAIKATSSTLTGWTTAVSAGDVLRFNLDSVSGLHRLYLVVAYSRP